MSDVRELIPELDLISVERTSLIVAPKREEKRITGREYRRMLRKWAFACGVELGIIIAMSLIIYILQARPI
ncbi:MAG TPA: hypothetical protein H9959_09580 [Candidatus Mediterraneibacter ornithocaccae]|nr:hypothetical protein [Candidatus Mediterraneibacter ornithocaccae]